VPADRALAFQAIDGEGRPVINEFTWIYVRPNENLSCIGCHTSRDQTPKRVRSMALTRPAVKLTGQGTPFRYKANSLTHGGVLGNNLDRIRETKSLNLYPSPVPLSTIGAPPLPPGRAATVKSVCQQLRNGTTSEKVSAAQHLGVLRDRAAAGALVEALRNANAKVRMNAALALSSCGNRIAVDPLLKGILDKNTQVALACNMALSHLTAHNEELKSIKKGDLTACADRWKQWLANNNWQSLEKQLIETLQSKDPQDVIMAVQSLGHVGGDAGRVALRTYAKRALDLKDRTCTRSLFDAMLALGHLGDSDSAAMLNAILKAHIRLANGERSVKLSEAAVEALGWIGTAEAEKALIERSKELLPIAKYNIALGDQAGTWGEELSCSPLHYRFLEAFDAMGSKLPEPAAWAFSVSMHMNYDQPLMQERDTYETLLARVIQRSDSMDTIIDSCFAMIGVGKGTVNEGYKKVFTAQVNGQVYAQMSRKTVAFTMPQRAAYVLFVLGIRPDDAPRYREAFEKYRKRYFEIRKHYRAPETGACAWICYHSLEVLGLLKDVESYDLCMSALADPPEVVDGYNHACNTYTLFATTPHYRVAAAFALGQIGNHDAVADLIKTVNNFDNALEVRHLAAKALVKLCNKSDLKILQKTTDNYPEVVTRRVLLEACTKTKIRK
jgi:HEAT repeat protein